jgi:hypothetical protein
MRMARGDHRRLLLIDRSDTQPTVAGGSDPAERLIIPGHRHG